MVDRRVRVKGDRWGQTKRQTRSHTSSDRGDIETVAQTDGQLYPGEGMTFQQGSLPNDIYIRDRSVVPGGNRTATC